jgi:biotin transporter BioY
VNKYFCVAITFWQYIWIDVKDMFTDKEAKNKSFASRVISQVLGILLGLLIGGCVVWLLNYFNIVLAFAKFFIWFVVFAVIVDVIALIIFLYISWRKAVNDCWDKFQAG